MSRNVCYTAPSDVLSLHALTLYEAPLHSPSSTSIRQLDVMSTSWNELLRHWRSGFVTCDTVHSDWMAVIASLLWTVWCFISWKAPEDRCYYWGEIFSLKFTKYRLVAGPAGWAKAAIRGPTSKGREGRGEGREGMGERKGREGVHNLRKRPPVIRWLVTGLGGHGCMSPRRSRKLAFVSGFWGLGPDPHRVQCCSVLDDTGFDAYYYKFKKS